MLLFLTSSSTLTIRLLADAGFDWTNVFAAGGSVLGCLLPGFLAEVKSSEGVANQLALSRTPDRGSAGSTALCVCSASCVAVSCARVSQSRRTQSLSGRPERLGAPQLSRDLRDIVSGAEPARVAGANGFFASDVDLFVWGLSPDAGSLLLLYSMLLVAVVRPSVALTTF